MDVATKARARLGPVSLNAWRRLWFQLSFPTNDHHENATWD